MDDLLLLDMDQFNTLMAALSTEEDGHERVVPPAATPAGVPPRFVAPRRPSPKEYTRQETHFVVNNPAMAARLQEMAALEDQWRRASRN